MLELLLILAVYSVLILFFVPLERIGKVQTKVKHHIERAIARLNK